MFLLDNVYPQTFHVRLDTFSEFQWQEVLAISTRSHNNWAPYNAMGILDMSFKQSALSTSVTTIVTGNLARRDELLLFSCVFMVFPHDNVSQQTSHVRLDAFSTFNSRKKLQFPLDLTIIIAPYTMWILDMSLKRSPLLSSITTNVTGISCPKRQMITFLVCL